MYSHFGMHLARIFFKVSQFPSIVSHTKLKSVGSFSRRVEELTTRSDFLKARDQKCLDRDLRKRSLNFHRFVTEKAPKYEVAHLEVQKKSPLRESRNLTLNSLLRSLDDSQDQWLSDPRVDRPNLFRTILANLDSIDTSFYDKIVDLIETEATLSVEEARVLEQIFKKCIKQGDARFHTGSIIAKIASRVLLNRNRFDSKLIQRVDRAASNFTDSSWRDTLDYLKYVTVLNRLHRRVLRQVKSRLIEQCDDAYRNYDLPKTPRFKLFADSNATVDQTEIVAMTINYLDVLKNLNGSTRSPKVYYSQLSRAISRFLTISSVSDIDRMKVVIAHQAAGLGPLHVGKKLVDDWIRTNRRLSTMPKHDLETVMHCARVSGYAHQFRLRRLQSACSKNNIAWEGSTGPVPDTILTTSTYARSWQRPMRRRLHGAMNSLRVERLDPDSVRKIANTNPRCNKTGCSICSKFIQRIALARCFHFPLICH